MNFKIYKFIASLLLLLFTSTLAFAQDADDKYTADLLKPGTEAPDFLTVPYPAAKQNGPFSKFSGFRGAYVLLDFWASWCPDCRKDIPEMKKIAEKYDNRIVIQSQSFDTDSAAWQRCIEKNKMFGPLWFHSSELKKWKKETTVDSLYHVNWIPTMYLIDPEGKVVLGTVKVEKMEAELEKLDKAGKLNQQLFNFPKFKQGGPQPIVSFLTKNLHYPEEAQQYGVEGKVMLAFLVNTDGSTDSIKVKESEITGYSKRLTSKMTEQERNSLMSRCARAFTEEGRRVVSIMKGWQPATFCGRPIILHFRLPITFRLQ